MLGALLWYSVPSAGTFDADRLREGLAPLGLDQFAPESPGKIAAFEKACRDLQGVQYDLMPGALKATIEIPKSKPRGSAGKFMRRFVERTVRNHRNEIVQVDNVAELMFFKPQPRRGVIDQSSARAQVNFTAQASPAERDLLTAAVVSPFYEAFSRYGTWLDAHAMRQTVWKSVAQGLLGVQVAGGATYFVPAAKTEAMERMRQVVVPMGVEISTLSQPDLPEQREFFSRVVSEHLAKGFADLTDKVTELESGRRTARQYLNHRALYDLLSAKTATLQDLVIEREAVADAALAAWEQLEKLRVDGDSND